MYVLHGGLPAWEEQGFGVYAAPGYGGRNAAPSFTPQQVRELLRTRRDDILLLDVREPEEFAEKHLPGAVNLPMSRLKAQLGTLDRQKSIILYCVSGGRSYTAIRLLRKAGFTRLGHLPLEAWEAAGLPLNRPGVKLPPDDN